MDIKYFVFVDAPLFIPSEKVVELVEGRSSEVNLTAKSHPAVHTYKWNKDGAPIPTKSDARVSSEGPLLYFNQVSRQDSGIYTCIAQNIEGTASAALTLNVLCRFAFTIHLTNPFNCNKIRWCI